jgi:hypothetical protein
MTRERIGGGMDFTSPMREQGAHAHGWVWCVDTCLLLCEELDAVPDHVDAALIRGIQLQHRHLTTTPKHHR